MGARVLITENWYNPCIRDKARSYNVANFDSR